MQANTAAIILAGGQSRRFQHRDKGLIAFQDKMLIEHVIERIEKQVSEIIIVCNRNQEQYQTLGRQLISDQLTDFQGPLAGIQAGLAAISKQYALTCPCDTPRLPLDLVEGLFQAMSADNSNIAYCHDGEREQYLPLMLNRSCQPQLNQFLASGQRSVKAWIKEFEPVSVGDFTGQSASFQNINSPQELDSLL